MSLYFHLQGGAELASWTYSAEIPPEQPDNIRFVNIASFDGRNEFATCLQLTTRDGSCRDADAVLGLGAATHELVQYTAELTHFLAQLPDFVTTVNTVSAYKFVEI